MFCYNWKEKKSSEMNVIEVIAVNNKLIMLPPATFAANSCKNVGPA